MRTDQKERSRRWYEKMKKDPVRYARIMARQKIWQHKYRASRSRKFLAMEMRRRARRSLDPFSHRRENKTYYETLRGDPVRYRAYLDQRKANYHDRMAKLRADPESYRAWLEARMVYHRYWRILRDTAMKEAS